MVVERTSRFNGLIADGEERPKAILMCWMEIDRSMLSFEDCLDAFLQAIDDHRWDTEYILERLVFGKVETRDQAKLLCLKAPRGTSWSYDANKFLEEFIEEKISVDSDK